MNKRRLSKILAKASPQQVQELAEEIKAQHEITVVKAPEKSLVMIKMRDPVKESLFYLGEVIVSEAIVDLDGAKGTAVLMGDDYEKALDMAVIDAASTKAFLRASTRWNSWKRNKTAGQSRKTPSF